GEDICLEIVASVGLLIQVAVDEKQAGFSSINANVGSGPLLPPLTDLFRVGGAFFTPLDARTFARLWAFVVRSILRLLALPLFTGAAGAIALFVKNRGVQRKNVVTVSRIGQCACQH